MYHLDNSDRPITFIDLFAGAGGLSEGFVSCGFKPIAHVEMTLQWLCENIKEPDNQHKQIEKWAPVN